MNVYVYDSFLNQKKYDSVLAKIEARLTDLGLNGKICRLGVSRNSKDVIENELKRGAKTIVAVGNDSTVSEAINVLAGKQIPLAIIPVGEKNNTIARAFGIDLNERACDVLAARRVETLDLGTINGFYFLSSAVVTNDGTIIEINKNYSIESIGKGETCVINFHLDKHDLSGFSGFSPQDGMLELYIKTDKPKKLLSKKEIGESLFSLKNLYLVNTKKFPIVIDGSKEIQTPVEIGIAPKAINIIVGKERVF